MRKIQLDVDALTVESFITAAPRGPAGTVDGHSFENTMTGSVHACPCDTDFGTCYGSCQVTCAQTCAAPGCDPEPTMAPTCVESCYWVGGQQYLGC
ncbi:MAG TPA: hypothetical protein VFQ39_04645 [Longimicrobium sp.]|nr:hypothetical protein [Longimicrobium sp.]